MVIQSSHAHIPVEQRKKILFLCDDFRLPSGIGTMAREIILNTSHRYKWVNLGSAINNPDAGKGIIMSPAVNEVTGLSDADVKLVPWNGYGDPIILRSLIKSERPDLILHFTDPRFWTWLYDMAHEIRQEIPIAYYTIWDDLPYPHWNKPFYESCDALWSISKQTDNIVRNVVDLSKFDRSNLRYIPHGINPLTYFPIPDDDTELQNYRRQLFGDKNDKIEFVVFYNNRNIRRKMTSDLIIAFKELCRLAELDAPGSTSKFALVLHTQIADENGTDLLAVAKNLAPECNIVFIDKPLETKELNYLYNIADVTANIGSNEGWGLSSTESMMAGTVIMNTVTGGLQDQMRFEDQNGNWINFNTDFATNHAGKYPIHGQWALPVYPATRSIQGSLATPYIFDDRVSWEDVARILYKFSQTPRAARKEQGAAGRTWACSSESMMSAKSMSDNFVDAIDYLLSTWKPRPSATMFKYNQKQQSPLPTGILTK